MNARRRLLATCMAAALAGPARADPITGAIAAVSGWVASSAIASTFLQLGVGLALSAWQRARAPRAEKTGIRIDQVLTGDTNPEAFTLGRSATAGASIGPYRSHGRDNGWLTMVIDLGGVPGMALEAVFVNGERCPLRYDRLRGDFGIPVEQEADRSGLSGGDYLLYVKVYDGSQTAADPHLLDKHGRDPDYPWTADMVGRGRCYAIVTAKYHREKQTSIPQIKFGLRGIPLYDPRRDATAGGVGAQRWSQPETWAYTENVAVEAYNLLRGIPVGPDLYGGRVPAANLPQGTFLAAMNEADRAIEELGGSVPQYRAGIEVEVDRAPAEVAETLLRTCSGALAETGGVWSIRVGAPAAPIHLITDDDVVVTRPQQLDPFPGLDQTINGITVTHPDPETAWEMREAPPIVRLDLEMRDDGRRLRESLALDACAYGGQVQRVALAYLEDSRRFARHVLPLPPDARHLRVLDTLAWRSERNQYGGKLFEVTERVIDLSSYLIELTLREVDPSDYEWTSDLQLPVATLPTDRTAPVIEAPGFEVTGIALPDGDGVDRRVALLVEGEDPGAPHDIEVRLALTQMQVVFLPNVVLNAGLVIQAGILPDQEYQTRVRYAEGGLSPEWSVWRTARTPDLRLGELDLTADLRARIEDAAEQRDIQLLAFAQAEDARDRTRQVEAGAEITAQEIDTISQSITVLDAETDNALFDITGEIEAVRQLSVTEAAAFADYQQTVSASFGDLDARVIQTNLALVDVEGFAFASVGLTAETDDGGIAGFRATSYANPDGTGGATLDLLGDVVRAGTMLVDRLVSGQGRNLLQDAEFAHGSRFWRLDRSGAAGAETYLVIRAAGQPYAGAADPTISIVQSGTSAEGTTEIASQGLVTGTRTLTPYDFTATPGEYYMASARAVALDCTGAMFIAWYDATGLILGTTGTVAIPATTTSGTVSPRLWTRHHVLGQAPADAAFGSLIVRKLAGTAPVSSVTIFEPQVEETHASARRPTAFSRGGTTLIAGGLIVTDDLFVSRAMILQGAVGAAQIEDAAITRAKIGALSVDTIRLAYGAVTGTTILQQGQGQAGWSFEADAAGNILLVTTEAVQTRGGAQSGDEPGHSETTTLFGAHLVINDVVAVTITVQRQVSNYLQNPDNPVSDQNPRHQWWISYSPVYRTFVRITRAGGNNVYVSVWADDGTVQSSIINAVARSSR